MRTIRTGTVDQAVAALRAGRPVLVSDSTDRENEVDAVIAAQDVDPAWLAWIIRHSSGYLCAPMTAERADALDLPLMVPNSQDPRRTAYTVTVDAATGVSTGISAADRARTLAVLAADASGPGDLIRPGHVLPLRAVDGGVLHRAGHTEAAVDLCRIAELTPVAGIAELVHDEGTMMRLEDAAALAEADDLVLLTIADLIAWRRARGEAPEPVSSGAGRRVAFTGAAHLPTAQGDFTIRGYRDLRTGAEHVALTAPGTEPADRPVVRVHSECLTGDALGSLRCDCGFQLAEARSRVARHGGAVIYLRGHEGRGIGLLAKIDAYALQDAGLDTVAANLHLGWPADRREYGAAAAILQDLGMGEVTLLTNNPAKVEGLRALGVVARLEGIDVGHTPQNSAYLHTKAERMGHLLGLADDGPPPATGDGPAGVDPAAPSSPDGADTDTTGGPDARDTTSTQEDA